MNREDIEQIGEKLPMAHPSMFCPHMLSRPGPVRMTTLIRLWRIIDPDLCASGALPGGGLFLRSRVVAGSEGGETTLENTNSLCPKSPIFSQFIAKFRLDNTTVSRYLNPIIIGCRSIGCLIFIPNTYWDSTGYSTQL